jgi:hypothetical protein
VRAPDYIIGGPGVPPLLLRWHLIRHSRWGDIFLHKILRSDDCQEYHRHPWWNISILLRGSYLEFIDGKRRKVRRAGSIVFRRAATRHRLEIKKGPVWTIFVTGPKRRSLTKDI